jgi:FdhD protein
MTEDAHSLEPAGLHRLSSARRRPGPRVRVRVRTMGDDGTRDRPDHLATEEPLEIRVVLPGGRRTLAVTMRTPGNDFELAVGFLLAEGVIRSAKQIRRIRYCIDRKIDVEQRYNILSVELGAAAENGDGVAESSSRGADPLADAGAAMLPSLERHFFTSSACGVCGKAGIEALSLRGCGSAEPGPAVPPAVFHALPGRLRDAQGIFDDTGGLHAAGLFDPAGVLLAAREDVGRHNAVDKLVGWAAMQNQLPLRDRILLVSGRSSYEILQKAAVAGVPIVCSISAPSSLAVDLARSFGITLVGFLRDRRFNVYTGGERVASQPAADPADQAAARD